MTRNSTVSAQEVSPVLEFPQAWLDDPGTYRGYMTRFFKDSDGNTIQVAINQNSGRVVNLWADAANESISFTIRDSSNQPTALTWGSPNAKVFSVGKTRSLQYAIASESTSIDVGFFLLSSMRQERHFQYLQRHLLPFDSGPFVLVELEELLQNMERLPANERAHHLAVLNAQTVDELHLRLVPKVKMQSKSSVLVEGSTFDGKNHLALELSVDPDEAEIGLSTSKISIRSSVGRPILLSVEITTDSPSLTPLTRDDIFTKDFLRFYQKTKTRKGRSVQFQRLQRQVKSVELLSYQEKLMAGLPNFATYFGRDSMMSALMMESIWSAGMLERVITTVLQKLKPGGEVSHEEGLGGQAIRENVDEYNRLIRAYLQKEAEKEGGGAGSLLTEAKKILEDLQKPTENYRMADDDFQLPVLAARYLSRSDISNDRKRRFLLSSEGNESRASRLSLLLRNLVYVSNRSSLFVETPVAENLVGFTNQGECRWCSGSWRDSEAGYANGRFAMDVNVIWVPKALESIERILPVLSQIGFSIEDLQSISPEIHNTKFLEYAYDPLMLRQAIKTWETARRFFEIRLSPVEVQIRVQAKLQWLPKEERGYWAKAIGNNSVGSEGIEFLALSLDEKGNPIPVANTDFATWLFLDNWATKILDREVEADEAIRRLRIFVTPYPVGLFVAGVGPLVANDTFASPQVWESFQCDLYHSPRTVWGREVNMLLLGLARQILAALDTRGRIRDPSLDPYVRELRAVIDKILDAVESSGLKYSELWSYRITGGALLPARYATSSDIQLWNLTDLAVQYLLERISGLESKDVLRSIQEN